MDERYELRGYDVESAEEDVHLYNDTVHSFSWESIGVRLYDKSKKTEKCLLQSIDGEVSAGDLVALMGPSGSGKTTLLNVLANRPGPPKAIIESEIFINGAPVSPAAFRQASCYVEQQDSLIGSLTARETLDFAAKLSLPSSVSKTERMRRVDGLLHSFGLSEQAHTIIGTPVRKGLSGGQVRRVGVASQLITCPKILFLDEPTSGLDSVASFEVMSYLKKVARRSKIIVIASIHQPSTTTFNLFDKLYLLSKGKLCYGGTITGVQGYFENLGYPLPLHMNPAEFILDLVNVGFARDRDAADRRLSELQDAWAASRQGAGKTHEKIRGVSAVTEVSTAKLSRRSKLLIPFTLIQRSFIKSYRDVVVYGIRIAMYMGLAIMMGTIWLRLSTTQENIQPFINAIFFGSAFMSFMAVAYVPAFLEDRATFVKERANGLYGPASFIIANFIIGLPYLFLISVLFSIVTYWLCNFRPTASAFFTWIMWLFLDLVAAESLVVLVSSLFPVFVIALALIAFANGLWMSVGGFLVSPKVINVFWRYWARYIDYQSYVFQGMMVNEFSRRSYTCGNDCTCMYRTNLASQCKIAGQGVLDTYGYSPGNTGKWVGILLAIVLGYRLLAWLVLILKRT
ncbi:MAG: hypothetical protein M1816_002609 [Peltula sp. TS41687]|nr:MAG: hypothetical protein M1816_002609 [Peltula sp. TS41687]